MALDDQERPKPTAAKDLTKTEAMAPSEVRPGTLLNDRYILIRQINQGGFGTVYLAHDRQMHDRPVVVKIQIDQRIDDPWFARKFSEEVRALSMIDHPGVVVAIDSGRTPDGMPFLVMQYVDGVTLRAVMNAEGMPLDRVAEIVKQIGSALRAAHERGIWHRDLKPENLMLQTSTDGHERVRLIDFGIATVADLKSKFQTGTRVAGTVIYMAPEQAMGQPSAQSDIYAMGLIAYEMVTGRRPFVAENSFQLAEMQRAGVRIKPSDLRPGVPSMAERLILRSLEFDPARRPANAQAFGDELHNALLDVGATRVNVHAVVSKGVRSRGKMVVLATAAAVILAGASYYEFRGHPAPPKVPQTAAGLPAKPAEVPTPEAPSQSAMEMAYWNTVKDSSEPELYQDYLDAYPHGSFAQIAKTKIKLLKNKPPAKAVSEKPGAGVTGIGDLTGLSPFVPNISAELKDWEALKGTTTPQPYRDFLAKYPHGMFATVVRLKISALEKTAGKTDSDDSNK